MIHRRIHIKNWVVDFFIDNGGFVDFYEIMQCLYEIGAEKDAVERALALFERDLPNEAFTCSTSMRRTCIYIGRTTSGKEFVNSIVHELRHLVDHIAKYYELDNGEAVGYISGDTAFLLADDICRLGCEHCTNYN